MTGNLLGIFIENFDIDRNDYWDFYDILVINSVWTSLVVRSVISRPGPWGTHSLRKTGYMLAVWGGGNVAQIMLSARH